MVKQEHLIKGDDLTIMVDNGVLMFRSDSRSFFTHVKDKTLSFCGLFLAPQVKQISDLIKTGKSKTCWIRGFDYEAREVVFTNGSLDLELILNDCEHDVNEVHRDQLRKFWRDRPIEAKPIKKIIPLIIRASRYAEHKHGARENMQGVWLSKKDIVATNGTALILLRNSFEANVFISTEECVHLAKMQGDVLLYESNDHIIISNKVMNIVKEKQTFNFVPYYEVVPNVEDMTRLPLTRNILGLLGAKAATVEIKSEDGIVSVKADEMTKRFKSTKYPNAHFTISPSVIGKEIKAIRTHHIKGDLHLFTIPKGTLTVMGVRTDRD